MIPEYLAVIGATIASFGGLFYFYETLRGRTKPNRITWLMWGLFPMIIFLAQRAQGVQGLSWLSFVAGFTPFLVFLASFFNKKSYWKSKRTDYYLMLAGVVGMIVWGITKNPNIAIVFALLADLFAGIPTILKAYTHPETESWLAYAVSTLGFGIGILSIQVFSFENFVFVAYLFALNLILAILSARKTSNAITGS